MLTTHGRSSSDCGQRLESTAHEAGRLTSEAVARAHNEEALGHVSPFHANEKPAHGFNETSYEMKDKLNPLDHLDKHKMPKHFRTHPEDFDQHQESVAHEESRRAGEAIAKFNDDVAHGNAIPNYRHVHSSNESSDELKDLLNPLDPPRSR